MYTETKKYTYDDYAKLPEGSAYQLINGELIMSPAPNIYHQKISSNLFLLISKYVDEILGGAVFYSPIDVYFDESETYQPDIIYISKNKNNIIKENKIEGAPDLVIEILSEGSAYYDLKHKKKIYEKYGVKEYWIVDPIDKSVEIHENRGQEFIIISSGKEKGLIKSKILDKLEIDIEKVFKS